MFAPQLNFHAQFPIAWSLQHLFRVMLRQIRNENNLRLRSYICLGDMTSLLQVQKNVTAVMNQFGLFLFEYFYRALSFIEKSFIPSVHTHTHTYTSTNMRMYPMHKYAHKHTQRHNKYRKKQACTMHKNIHTQTHKIHIHCTEHGRFCCWATQVLNLVLTSVENTFKCWRRNL